MSDAFEVTWEVDDGYAGGARPQRFEIDESELEAWDADDVGELFDQMLYDEFRNNIHFWSGDREAFIEWARSKMGAQS